MDESKFDRSAQSRNETSDVSPAPAGVWETAEVCESETRLNNEGLLIRNDVVPILDNAKTGMMSFG